MRGRRARWLRAGVGAARVYEMYCTILCPWVIVMCEMMSDGVEEKEAYQNALRAGARAPGGAEGSSWRLVRSRTSIHVSRARAKSLYHARGAGIDPTTQRTLGRM